jgi:hypothetical protein
MTLGASVTSRYWSAVKRNDCAGALAVIREVDAPWFDHVMTYRGGFDAAMHGAMELQGLCGRWRRPPYCSLSDAEMERLSETHQKLGVS